MTAEKKRPNEEIYELVADRARGMMDEAELLVREANTLHRMCEVMRPGEFHHVDILPSGKAWKT